MGLGTKIKNALHGDERRSPRGSSDYEDGRVPGSFPSESDTAAGRTGTHGTVDNDASLTGRTDADGLSNTHSTLRKGQNNRHQKSDSGVGFANDGLDSDVRHSKHGAGYVGNNDATLEQPQPVKPNNKLGGKQDPYWGNINNNNARDNTTANTAGVNNGVNTTGVSNGVNNGFEKDLPLRPEQGNNRDVYAKDLAGHNGTGIGHNSGGVGHSPNSMLHPEHTNKDSVLDPRSNNRTMNTGSHNGGMLNNSNTAGHNGGMLNNSNTLNSLGGDRDPYWNNGNSAGLDGQAYGVNNGYAGNNFNNDSMYGNTAPGSAVHGDYNNGTSGLRGGHHNNTATRGAHGRGGIDDPHDVAASGLTDRNLNSTGDRGVGLGSAGMVSPRSPVDGALDDGRIRDRDMGRSPNNYGTGVGAGVGGIAASEAARRHHEEDLRDAGLTGHGGRHNNTTYNNNSVNDKMNGNSVAGARAAYARSAGGNSPPRTGMQNQGGMNAMGGGVGSNQYGQQQQHQQGPTSSSWNGPGAHNPARVLHTCSNCGVDNDISQYFRPDVAYRLGQ